MIWQRKVAGVSDEDGLLQGRRRKESMVVANWRKEIKQTKKRSLREGKDMGDYLLTNISKRGIISCRFLSFFPINPEARQAVATAMRAPTLSLAHNGSTDPVLINYDLNTGACRRGVKKSVKRERDLSLSLLLFSVVASLALHTWGLMTVLIKHSLTSWWSLDSNFFL